MKSSLRKVAAGLFALMLVGLTASAKPLDEDTIVTLLGAGFSDADIAERIGKEGYSGSKDPETLKKLRAAGAGVGLILAVKEGYPRNSGLADIARFEAANLGITEPEEVEQFVREYVEQNTLTDRPSQAATPNSGIAQEGAKKAVDSRIQKLLDKAKLTSTIDNEGDHRLNMDLGGGRTQLIWVISNTSQLDSLEIREVWSIAYKSKTPFNGDVANQFLKANRDYKVGAWQMAEMGDDFVAVFSAQILADTDYESLVTVINAVAKTADSMEQKLSKGDEW
jgi:hypothetical protein